ncbi:MAG: hypothetical protein PHQ23_14585 [Candidatus Wallbacteria bacterium]|nr:hypothetical protein [Candidatus Wallbacteria bacterium]
MTSFFNFTEAGLTTRLCLPVLLSFCISIQAGDLAIDTRTDFHAYSCGTSRVQNLTRVFLSQAFENGFSQLTLKNHYLRDTESFSIDRAFVELYHDRLTFSIGKQRIYWGCGQVFNYADIFNTIDPTRPSEEKDGVKSVMVRYNPDATSRVELACSDQDTVPGNSALRWTFTSHGWEFMLNALKVHRDMSAYFPGLYSSSQDLVAEVKGGIGCGIWATVDFRSSSLNRPIPVASPLPADNRLYTMGLDYTFTTHGHNLYTMLEASYDSDLDSRSWYFSHRLDLSDVLFFSQSLYKDERSGLRFLGNALDYAYSDIVSLRLELNAFDGGSATAGLAGFDPDLDREIKFSVRAVF